MVHDNDSCWVKRHHYSRDGDDHNKQPLFARADRQASVMITAARMAQAPHYSLTSRRATPLWWLPCPQANQTQPAPPPQLSPPPAPEPPVPSLAPHPHSPAPPPQLSPPPSPSPPSASCSRCS